MKPMGRVALLGCTRSSHFEIDYYGKVHGRGISLIGAHTLALPKTTNFRFRELNMVFYNKKNTIARNEQ